MTAIAVVTMYLLSVSHHWYISDDSAVYLALGENLAAGNGYTVLGRPHTKFPPGFPFYLAALRKVGVYDMVWLNLLMTAVALAAVWTVWALLRQETSRRLALLVTLVTAFTYQMFSVSTKQLSDVPCMLLVCLGLWAYCVGPRGRRGLIELGTLALAASCWVRIAAIPLAIGAVCGMVVQHRMTNRWRTGLNVVLLITGVASAAAWVGWQQNYALRFASSGNYLGELSMILERSALGWIFEPIKNLYGSGNSLSHLASGQEMPLVLAACIFLVPMLVGMVVAFRRRSYVVVLAVAAYLGALLLMRPPIPRYLLPIAPLLLLFLLQGMYVLVYQATQRRRVAAQSILAIACVLLAMNLVKDIRLVYRLRHSDFNQFRDDSQSVQQVASYLRQNAGARQSACGSGFAAGYLSGVPLVGIDRRLAVSNASGQQVLEHLDRESVDFVIVHRHLNDAYTRVLRKAVQDTVAFRRVCVTADLEVFERERSEIE